MTTWNKESVLKVFDWCLLDIDRVPLELSQSGSLDVVSVKCKHFLDQNIFGSHIVWDPNFSKPKFFRSKIFLDQRPNIFLGNFVWYQ